MITFDPENGETHALGVGLLSVGARVGGARVWKSCMKYNNTQRNERFS